MKKVLGSFLVFAVALLCFAPAGNAAPICTPTNPMQFVGPSTTTGNGLGAVLTSVTIQNNGSEQGCVAWNGTADVIGAAACPSPLTGGDEKTGASQTQTRTLSELGTTDAANVVMIFNGSENDNTITLNDIRLTIWDAAGNVVYQSAPLAAPETFGPIPTFGGTGGAGSLFILDPTDAACLNAANVFSNGTWRIGAAGSASGSSGGNETFSFSRKCPIITISPASLPTATQGQAYNVSGTVTGGVTPYTSITANPAGPYFGGITFTSNTTTGTFSFAGTPTTTGTLSITVTATDANLCTGTITYSLQVNPGTCPTITVSPTTIPGGTAGVVYPSQVFTASGGTGPYTFALTGTLPNGMGFVDNGDSTATLSGTPTQSGSFPITVTATDTGGAPAGCTGNRGYTLVIVCPTISIAPTSIPNGTSGVLYPTQTFVPSGGTGPYTMSNDVGTTGTLPTGLTIDNTAHTLSGTPTSGGNFSFTITFIDADGCPGQRTYSLIIQAATCEAITVNPSTLPSGTAGVVYGPVNFTATITPPNASASLSWTHTGALPTGMNFQDNGDGTATLSGTPTQTGSFPITVTVTDANSNPANCQGSQGFTLVINCPTITISPATVPDGALNTVYGPVTFTQTGGVGTVTFSETGTLPTGIQFTAGTATLAGTPTQSGTFNFSIKATDSTGCNATKQYSLFIPAPPNALVNVPTLGYPALGLLALALAGTAFLLIRKA